MRVSSSPRKLRCVRAPRAPWRLQGPPGPCWSAQVPQVLQNKRFARDILEYSARGVRHPRAGTRKVNLLLFCCVPVGAPDLVIYIGLFEKRVYHLFYKRKRGSADLVIYRGSEMGVDFPRAGTRETHFYVLLLILPRYLSNGNPPASFK